MTNFLTAIKAKSKNWLFRQIVFLGKSKQTVLSPSGEKVQLREEPLSSYIAVLGCDTYIKLKKRYKVISKKDLLQVIKNEKSYLSPFDYYYLIFRCSEVNDGEWEVTFYFIDKQSYPSIDTYLLVFVWEDIVRSQVNTEYDNAIVSAVSGNVLVTRENNEIETVAITANSNLKQKVLFDMQEILPRTVSLDNRLIMEWMSSYLLSVKWGGLYGCFNSDRIRGDKLKLKIKPVYGAWLGAALIGLSVLESLYLIGMNSYIDSSREKNSAELSQYLDAKSVYMSDAETYNSYRTISALRSNVSVLPDLLTKLPSQENDLTLERLDYIEGEVRVTGYSSNIQSVMAFLSDREQVVDLEFVSPITPGSNGRDKFSIKFRVDDE